jgi:YHS domain-containing protein/uncharacterized protein YjbJ (UPF0337 family)
MAAARPITDGVGLTPGYATNSSFAQAASVHMGQMQNQANAASRQIAGQVQQAAGQVQQAAVQTQQQVAGAASQVGSDFMKQMAAFNQAAKVKLQNTVTADQKLAINPALAAPTTPTPPTSNQGPTVNYGRPATGAGASIIPARPMAPTADTLRGGLQPTQAMMAEAAAAVPSTDIYSPAVVVNSTIPQASPKVVSKPQPVAAPPAAIQATPSRPQPTLQASIPTANGSSTNQLATASVPTARLQSVPTQSGEPAVDGRARTIPAQVQSSVASKPANTSGFALSGYDCVALMDGNEWVKGDARWGARHRGQVFLFQTAAAQQSFLANPEGYSPVLAGYDPVIFHETGEYEMGSRAHGVRYKDKMFLFTSEASLQRFWKAPWQYSQSAEVASRVSR